jgi:cytoplasmic iron level regulating protein YaaA (DUF328/UPF0246 family)
MSGPVAILIPPSAGKAPGGRGAPWSAGRSSLPVLDAARAQVVAATGLSTAHTMAAIQRYTGVLATELDWKTLPPGAKRRGTTSLLIATALLGMVGPGDPVPDHRLAMDDSLDGIGRLATFWRPRLTDALAEHLEGRVVWDLLPQEHAAAWDSSIIPARRRRTARFIAADGKTVTHWNKLLKGALTRAILCTGASGPKPLVAVVLPQGYRLDPASSATELVFTQPV